MNGKPVPIPLTLVAGAPGAGKSRFVRDQVAAAAPGATLAVLTGMAGDARPVPVADDPMTEPLTASGCLCCSGGPEVIRLLEDRLRARDNHRIPPFDRVLVELDGLADPVPAFSLLAAHPYLRLRFALTGLLTVIDSRSGEAMLKRLPMAVRQVELADRILVSGPPATAALAARLAALAPHADVTSLADGQPGTGAMTAHLSTAHWPPAAQARFVTLGMGRAGARRANPGEQTSAGAEQWIFSRVRPLSDADLARFVACFESDSGARILRASGQVRLMSGVTIWLESVLGHIASDPSDMPAGTGAGVHLILITMPGTAQDVRTELMRLLEPSV